MGFAGEVMPSDTERKAVEINEPTKKRELKYFDKFAEKNSIVYDSLISLRKELHKIDKEVIQLNEKRQRTK